MKTSKIILLLTVLFYPVITTIAQDRQPLKLWYKQPAAEWVEALPVGNGRLGAMVYGNPEEELIQLNEETLWSGRPVNPNPNPQAVEYLPEVRQALFNGDWKKAEQLCTHMQGYYTQSYLPLADLKVKHTNFAGEAGNYYRDLSLTGAVAHTTFTINGITYEREVFISAPDQLIVVKIRSLQKGKVSFDAALSSLLQNKVSATDSRLVMKGDAPVHVDPNYLGDTEAPVRYIDQEGNRGMRFEVRMQPGP
ncbi:MAG: glycoside hydrolase family 95 protein [Tannerellaceae bacterium]|nr:glycoside hydrolase family 95 protein [Tannerellaceae bacterium]